MSLTHYTFLSVALQDAWGNVFSPGAQSVYLARSP